MRAITCGLLAALVWQSNLFGAQDEQAALAEYLHKAPDQRLLNASIVVLASPAEKNPSPKNPIVRVERCVKAPDELKGATLTLKLTGDQEKSFQSLRGKALIFLNVTGGKTYELLDDEAIQPYMYAEYFGPAERLQAYGSRLLKEIDAIEPGVAAWAMTWSAEPGHLTGKGMLLPKETDLTPAKLFALGSLAWLWSHSDVRAEDEGQAAPHKFGEYASAYRQHHNQATDAFRDALMTAELARVAPLLTPEQRKKFAALNTDAFLNIPALPDFYADARTDEVFQPMLNAVNLALLADNPCHSYCLEFRKRPYEFFESIDAKLLGSAPEKLFDSEDKIARSMGITLLMLHLPERLKVRLRDKFLTEGYSFTSTMEYFGGFLTVKDNEGMAAVLGAENIIAGDNSDLLTIIQALIQQRLLDPKIAHAVGRLHNLVLRDPKAKLGGDLIKLFTAYEARLDPALRKEVTPDRDGETEIANALAASAQAQIGPKRDDETGARCDARNREAMAMLWDAKWIRREDKAFDIQPHLEKAAQYISPPAMGNRDFHADGVIEAVDFYSAADKVFLLTGDDLGRIVVWDMVTGKIVRTLGQTGHRILFLSVSGKYLLAAHSAGEYTAWDLEAGKELWTAVKKIESPTKWDPTVEYVWDALVYVDGADVRCRVLRGDNLLTYEMLSGKELSNIPLPPKTHISRNVSGSNGNCSFDRDGKTLAGSNYEGALKCFTIDGRVDLKWTFKLDADASKFNRDPLRMTAFSPSGKRLAMGHMDGSVSIVNLENGKEISHFGKHADQPSEIEFIDEDRVASASKEGDLKISDMNGQELVATKIPKGRWRLLPNGHELVLHSGAVWSVVDVKTGKVLHENSAGTPAPVILLKLYENTLLASGGHSRMGNSAVPIDGETVIFDIKSGQITKHYPRTALDVSADGAAMLCVHGNELSMVEMQSGKPAFTRIVTPPPEGSDNWFYSLDAVMAPGGHEFYQTLPGGGVARCNAKSGEQLDLISAGDPIYAFDQLHLDASGKLLLADAVIESTGQGILFTLGSSAKLMGPLSYFDAQAAVAFSPDSKVLILHGNYAVRLDGSKMPLEFARGLGPMVFEERGSESIHAVAFSPDAKWFATVDQFSREPWDIEGRDTIIRVFETANWTLRARYDAGPRASAICWKPDSRTAYIGHANGMISELELIPEKH